jgi:hypothetical protein
MNRSSMFWCFALPALLFASVSFCVLVTVSAQTREETKEAKIKRAMTGGPLAIAKNAKIVEFGANGSMTTLREGSNGWTCFPGSYGEAGNDMCLDEPAMRWLTDLIAHKPTPTNTWGNQPERHRSLGDRWHAHQGTSALGDYLAV